MANTYTSINDIKIMQDGLAALKVGLTPLKVFALDVGSDPAQKNEYVYVPLATARTGASYSNTYEDGNTTITGVSVRMTQHLMAPWHITEAQAAMTTTKAFEMSAVECGYALAAIVQNTVLNDITVAHFGSTEGTDELTFAASACDADKIAELRKVCVKTNKWRELTPGYLGALVLDGAYTQVLMSDPAIRDRSASNKDALVSGQVGRLYGFDLFENNMVTASTPGTGENLVGFAAQPGGLACAVRPIQPFGGKALEFEQIVTDPDSGISMSYRRWVNTGTGDMWGTFTVLMGSDLVDASRLVAVRSA